MSCSNDPDDNAPTRGTLTGEAGTALSGDVVRLETEESRDMA
jgi:hypothetical protein